MKLFEITSLLALCFMKCIAEEGPLVRIPQGFLRGFASTDRYGDVFYNFQSIPYARPPVGKLRFRAPVAAGPWKGIRDATPNLPTCLQHQVLIGQGIAGQEDCLYLSVYTPQLPQKINRPRAVMLFIHGGAFSEGSGDRFGYGPEFLITEDIIIVLVNYRVGLLGSLSIDDPKLGVPGNAGMKDLVMALRWVQENIEFFGGNPRDVTVFGSSAGSVATHLLTLSPMAKGLFHKAIFQSGVALAPWTLGIQNTGLYLAEYLNIQTENLRETLRILQSLPGSDIVTAQLNISDQLQLLLGGISNPIVEFPSNEPAFLPDDPFNIIRSGNYNNVSILNGYNDNEGLFFGASHLLDGFFLNLNFLDAIPREFNIDRESETAAEVASLIRRFYFGEEIPTILNIQNAFELYTDLLMSFPAYRSAVEHVASYNRPVYFYRFSVVASRNLCLLLLGIGDLFPGATHCDELGYIFNNIILPPVLQNSVEEGVVNRMVKYWTNFAKYGKPSLNATKLDWKPVSENKFNYVDIGTLESVPGVDVDSRRIAFWKNLYAVYFTPTKKI